MNGFHVHIAAPLTSAGHASDHLHLLVLRNEDRPGRVGAVGVALGQMDVNIGAMDVGFEPNDPSAMALMALTVSRTLSVDELSAIRSIDGIEDVSQARM